MTARRIAIVGSFSTGKTTLSTALAERLDLPLLPDVARGLSTLGFELDKAATPELETLIFLRQFNGEISTEEFVADYSLIHVMAYAGWVLDTQPYRREMLLWEECERLAERTLYSNYSHVFYLPIEFGIIPDGLRPDDPAFQKEIDRRVVDLLETHRIAYTSLTGSVEERLAQIEAYLDPR